MAKSPRSAAKQESDKVYNQRRRAKRALERLMRDTAGASRRPSAATRRPLSSR